MAVPARRQEILVNRMNKKYDGSIRQVIEQAPCQYKIETIPIGETLRDANDITRHQPVFVVTGRKSCSANSNAAGS